MTYYLILAVVVVVLLMSTVAFLASRYRRCPSDRILVIYGRVGTGQSARCIHGGGTFVWPLIQDYSYMSLVPMTITIPLQNALSLQNIRIHVPSTFTVGISTHPQIITNAAERLLTLRQSDTEEMAREIIFGQLRLTVASLTIEQINQDREKFLESIRKNVEPELNKIGLYLINVNITDITDESDYIDSIGKKAASEAINRAKVDVAEQDKVGAVGQAEANRERAIRVAENEAQAEKGRKAAEADQRVFVQQQETTAAVGEADALKIKTVRVAENVAEAEKGKKAAEADRRVYVQQQESEAVKGENESKGNIARYNAELARQQAEAHQKGEVAQRMAEVEIQKAQYQSETERLNAAEVVQQEVDKRKIEIAAEAQAERTRREARGEADATLMRYEAEAEGVRKVLENKAAGYARLIQSCHGDAKSVGTLLMIEKIEQIVAKQVEAISNLKIDKITVWDSGNGGNGESSTANFVSGLIKSLPPLQEVARMAGVELPEYLGKVVEQDRTGPQSESGPPASAATKPPGGANSP